jgi:tetratricopeptide (TPR) repeat protein
LENSEKSLTFAAQQFVDRIIVLDAKPEIQNWMAGSAKVLLEKALEINPNNDSSIINLGVCYTFADISNDMNQLMPTILRVKSVIDRNPDNELGQLVLGLGGIISKQYEKAIERFKNVLRLNPNNIFAYLNLAGCYELTNQNGLAIEIYTKLKGIANKPEARELYDSKIEELKKKN